MNTVHNRATGEHIRFVEQTPERLIFEDRIEAGHLQPPPHVHPHQIEVFTLLEGAFELQIGARWHAMQPGQRLEVPRGTAHTFRIPSGTHATLRVEFSPALDTERIFRTFAKAGERGRINPLYIGLIATETRAGFHLGRVPDWIQRPLVHTLALLARMRGLRLEPASGRDQLDHPARATPLSDQRQPGVNP
jgi:mannose-6-phosphate isomerase-like protein (cupin superfamily)